MNTKFASLSLCFLLSAHFVQAQSTPNQMSYQGRVTDASGVLIGNTSAVNRTVTFKLYSGPIGGSALYAETQTVTISGGEFSVLIGNGTGISGSPGPSAPASPTRTLSDIINAGSYTNLYLGITVDDGTAAADLEISPRQQMVSGAFALRSKVAETVAGGAVTTAMMGDGQVTTSKIASGAVDSSRIADSTIVANDIANNTITAGKLDTGTIGLWSPVGSSVYRGSGYVGIGESNPGFPLNFASSLGDKISLFGNSGNHYGFGIQNSLLQIHGDTSGSNIALGYGSSSSFTETMRIQGNGNVGIGTKSPTEKLMVSGGSLRVASTSNPNVAIANVNSAGETTNQATLGVATSAGSGSSSAAANDAILKSDSSKLILQSGSGAAAIVIDTANNVTTGNLYARVLMANNYSNSHSQGAHLEWNKDGGSGATYFLNQKGLGGGGMIFGEVSTSNDVSERMRIASNGFVGINTNSPGAPLHVSSTTSWGWDTTSSASSSNSSSGPQKGNPDAFTANGAYASGNNNSWPLTIYADGVVAGSAFVATSDQRIKDIVARSSTRGDLDLINQLQVTDYRLKDREHAGTAVRKGFIAQEVRKVIPEAVSTSRNYLPDIYQPATKCLHDAKQKHLSVTVAKPHALAAGDWVRVYVDKTMLETEVLEVSSPTVFVVAAEKAVARAFVFGRRVDDFLSVDYDRIFTTGIGAIQELDGKLKNESTKVDQLQKKVADLESRFAAQARQAATRKAETADGKAALRSKRGSDLQIDYSAVPEITLEKDAEINQLKTKNAELEARLSALEKLSAAK